MFYRILVVALLISAAGPAIAAGPASACVRPDRPAIPDGSSTTEKALLEARTALEQYLSAGDAYLTCLREYEEGLGEAITEVDGHEIVMRYNAMVDEMYLAGDEFNIALRRFKNQSKRSEK